MSNISSHLQKLIEAIPPPSLAIGEAFRQVAQATGMLSVELLGSIAPDDWLILIKKNSAIVCDAIKRAEDQTGQTGDSESQPTSAQDTQNQESKSPSSAVLNNPSGQSSPKIPTVALVQLKTYANAISEEARRWSRALNSESDEVLQDKDSSGTPDDSTLSKWVDELSEVVGLVPYELIPPARLVKALRRSSSSFVDFKIFYESVGDNSRKRVRTTVSGKQVLCLDDDYEDGASNSSSRRPQKYVKLGDWLAFYPKYVTALCLVDEGCRKNILALFRYQLAIGKMAANGDWCAVYSLDQRYRYTIPGLVATGVPLHESFSSESHYSMFFARALSEVTISNVPDRVWRDSSSLSDNSSRRSNARRRRGKSNNSNTTTNSYNNSNMNSSRSVSSHNNKEGRQNT